MIVGPAPRMGTPYVEILPAPKFSAKAAGLASGLQEDLKADSTSVVWSPACGSCVQRQLICRQGYNANQEPLVVCAWCHRTKHKCGGKGSATPTKSRKPAARSRSRRRASMVNVAINTDDEASSTGNVAAATITAATTAAATTTAIPATTAAPSTPAPATTPTVVHVPVPDTQTVLALKEELVVFQTMVASLVERVGTGKQLLQEANQCLAEQEANAKLLTDQVAALQQVVNPAAAESPAAEPLPVVMRTDAAETLAAATAQPEDDLPTTATAPQEDEVLAATTTPPEDEVPAQQDESLVVVTVMNVDESTPPQVTGAVMEQELASNASTAHWVIFVYYYSNSAWEQGVQPVGGKIEYHVLQICVAQAYSAASQDILANPNTPQPAHPRLVKHYFGGPTLQFSQQLILTLMGPLLNLEANLVWAHPWTWGDILMVKSLKGLMDFCVGTYSHNVWSFTIADLTLDQIEGVTSCLSGEGADGQLEDDTSDFETNG
ncbi:hypothetical protein EDB19DRAFT_1836740 [Suillus lakei]|nr:hypothetical protein EDB19DRAFT_1836740 [Suillus lakei]